MSLKVIEALKHYTPPPNWPGNIFLLPQDSMAYIHDFIVSHNLRACIELGTGFGATSCIMASAVQELGGGRVITVDKYLHQPVNVKVLMQHVGLEETSIEVIVDILGYNWYMADLIETLTHKGKCTPIFDFCLLDGAHEWEPDALAFTLITRLMKPGGWVVLDDLNFNLRMVPNWSEVFPVYNDRQLDTYQIRRVWDLIVRQHTDFTNFRISHNDRIGWAQKKLHVPNRNLINWMAKKIG